MKTLFNNIINLGVLPDMEQFKAARIMTFNRIVIIFFFGYISTFPLNIYLGINFLSNVIGLLTLCLTIPLYLSYKGNLRWARYSLTLNAWALVISLSIYLGEGGGHVFTLITAAILWFIIYNKKAELIVIELINLAIAGGVLYTYYAWTPIWDGDQSLLLPLKVLLIALSISVAMITIAVFKTNNYKFVALIREQKMQIEQRKEEMESSIRYAQGIQLGLLPKREQMEDFVLKNFVLYRPKDIVSGDFYWIHEDEKRAFLVLGDCTGHGVPGAMVSIMGMSSLDSVIETNEVLNPAQLLKLLDLDFMAKMSRSNLRDGMDVSAVMFDKQTKQWSFAGTNNSITYVKDGELAQLKGDKVPIGNHTVDIEEFTNHDLPLSSADKIFMYSDGYRDQFGGEKGKKFGMKRFNSLLSEIASANSMEGLRTIENRFDMWKGSFEQIDDVSLVGVEID